VFDPRRQRVEVGDVQRRLEVSLFGWLRVDIRVLSSEVRFGVQRVVVRGVAASPDGNLEAFVPLVLSDNRAERDAMGKSEATRVPRVDESEGGFR
jgi:hypothetical protein